jgi:hypothetical protein
VSTSTKRVPPRLTNRQVRQFAVNGSNAKSLEVRSLAQEVEEYRAWADLADIKHGPFSPKELELIRAARQIYGEDSQ